MRVLYYDCFAGIAGDMNLGAMIDLGVEQSYLRERLALLGLSGYQLLVSPASKMGIGGTRVEVIVEDGESPSPEDESYHDHHHGEEHHHDVGHHHETDSIYHDHEHPHEHEHHHDGCHHDGGHQHRSFSDIKALIEGSGLSDEEKSLSLKIFSTLAEAEGKVHGKPIDEVRFHEVGAVDSIVDIVGGAICLVSLSPDAVYCSRVELGGGSVACAHGLLPVPAPATALLVQGMPVHIGGTNVEMTTPTGAAILKAIVSEFTDGISFTPERIGCGIGSRDTEIPNILRVFLGESASGGNAEASEPPYERGEAIVLETTIDDMSPELFGEASERLFAAGAVDVFLTPVYMKKGRPGINLTVLTMKEKVEAVKEAIFLHTTTIGIREYPVKRSMLRREVETVATPLGNIRYKRVYYGARVLSAKPEYEDVKRCAEENNLSLREAYERLSL